MMRTILFLTYALLPCLFFIGIVSVAWFLATCMEICTTHPSVLRTIFSSICGIREHSHGVHPNSNKSPFPGDTGENIFWFVQVSDLHISRFRDFNQVTDMKEFCQNFLSIIKPSLVLVTGDLTDAKDATLLGSKQYKDEWQSYAALTTGCQNILDVPFLDIRGNHDGFAVAGYNQDGNLFEKYGLSKDLKGKSGSYQYVFHQKNGKYAFNGIDIVPNPGPGRPFNFFGIPDANQMKEIELMASQRSKFNATIWFGHYPLSVTTQPHRLRTLIGSGIMYLCGHLHTLLGWMPQMHTIHREGFMELELGDWKENRKFRIVAVDHDIVSFTDATYPQKPIILVTNPTDARYALPEKEPIFRGRNSTHIRFLVFSDTIIVSAMVKIDDRIVCNDAFHVFGPLHCCMWSPTNYLKGIHSIEVIVEDNLGRIAQSSFQFSLEGTRPPLSLKSVLLLVTDFNAMAKMLYVLTVCLFVILPLLVKYYSHRYHIGVLRELIKLILPQVMNFIENDRIFWMLTFYNLYSCVGPLSIGYFVPDAIGVAFPYGIYSNGYFIQEPLLYVYTTIHISVFSSIMMIYVGEILSPLTDIFSNGLRRYWCNLFRSFGFHASFIFLIWFQFTSARMFWIAYGKLSFFLNPMKTWSIPVMIYMFYTATLVYVERHCR